ncbi:hypothetical protein [Stackebrandtia soli]|uniref:hypothetical protein n=1 Tax=Stackebrandtia soli TaxID=1892856 RepID=UPI0039E8E2BD
MDVSDLSTGVTVEVWDGAVWVDVTDDVTSAVPIQAGSGGEPGVAPAPSQVAFELDNGTGRYTPRPSALLRFGTRARVRVVVDGEPFTRFLGDVVGVEPYWPAGRDGAAHVAVTASGVIRRLGQGRAGETSAMSRGATGYVAYWPLEDGPGTVRAASGVTGVPAMWTAAGRRVAFAEVDTAPGSLPLPDWRASTGSLTGTIPGGAFDDVWSISAVIAAEPGPVWPVWTVSVNGNVWVTYTLAIGDAVTVIGADRDDIAATLLTVPASRVANGAAHWVTVTLATDPLGLAVAVTVDGVTVGTATHAALAGVGRPTMITARPRAAGGLAVMGHLAVTAAAPTDGAAVAARLAGHPGENTGARILRVAAETNVPVDLIGDATGSAPLGPDTPAPVLAILTDAAAADGGILTEHPSTGGLVYRTRASLYNQPAALDLDADRDAITPAIRPVVDDQTIRNDITVNRTNGGAARAVADDGPSGIAEVGRYDEQVTVSVAWDEQLPDIAGWRLHLGTAPGPRYPVVPVDLAARGDLIAAWCALRLGDRVTLAGLPGLPGLPPTSLIVTGYTETLTPSHWDAVITGVPGGPWRVAVRDAADRYDTAGCATAHAIDATATTLDVDTTTGPPWSTDAVPFDVAIGDGDTATVTAVDGTGPTQRFTLTRHTGAIAHPAGTAVRLAAPAIRAR